MTASSSASAPASGLLIIDGKIHSIADYDQLAAQYPDVQKLDLCSHYLFPGLINTHVHLEFDTGEDPRKDFLGQNNRVLLLQCAENANCMLRSGVTTIRDAGSTWGILDLLDPYVSKRIPLPRLQLAGPPMTVTGGHMHFFGEENDTIDELIKSVRLHQKRGCTAIKLVVSGGQMTPGSGPERTSYNVEQIQAITKEAHHLNLPTFAHCLTTEGFVNTIRGGVQSVEHLACFKRNPQNQLLERVYENDVMESFRGCHNYFMEGITAMYHALDDYRCGKKPCTAREEFLLKQEDNMFDIFHKAQNLGLIPVIGTDAGVPFTYFDETWLEMEVLVERGGLAPAEVIHMATVNAAACLGLSDVTGQLREGYSADMIALSKNPLEDIRALRKVEQVICQGKIVL